MRLYNSYLIFEEANQKLQYLDYLILSFQSNCFYCFPRQADQQREKPMNWIVFCLIQRREKEEEEKKKKKRNEMREKRASKSSWEEDLPHRHEHH